jgi:oligosaccharide repeat unit polymerase
VTLLGIIAVVFGWRLMGGYKRIANLPVLFTLAFFVYAVVSLYLAEQADNEFGMSNLKLYLIRGVAPSLLIMTFNQPLRRVRVYFSATLVFTSMSIVMSVLAYAGLIKTTSGTWGAGRIGLFGFDPISFALPFGVACVIAYHHFMNSEKLYTRPLAVLFLCASFVAIIPTGSRQIFVALAAGILVYTYFAYPSLIKRVVMGLISCVIISLALFIVISKVGGDRYDVTSSGYNKNKQVSFAGRITTMKKGLDTFSESPLFGVGSGGHGKYIYTTNPRTGKKIRDKEHVHNLFIELLAEYGLVGFALFMTSMAIAVRRLLKNLRLVSNDPVARSNYSLLLGLMAFAVVQANISGGLAVSGGFISMLVAWMSIMPDSGQPQIAEFPENTVPVMAG